MIIAKGRGEAAGQHVATVWRIVPGPAAMPTFAACLNITRQGPTHMHFKDAWEEVAATGLIEHKGKRYALCIDKRNDLVTMELTQ